MRSILHGAWGITVRVSELALVYYGAMHLAPCIKALYGAPNKHFLKESYGMHTRKRKLFRPGDLLFWGLLLVLGYYVQWASGAPGSTPAIALVEIAGKVQYQIDLNLDRTYSLDEFDPPVELTVAEGTVRISRNDCPQKICQKMGAISRTGQMIVCVPRKLLIYIPARHDSEDPVKVITG